MAMTKLFCCILIALLGIGCISGQDAAAVNDLKVLNYALTLEHLEATFYNTFQDKYSAQNFGSANLDPHLYDYLTVIRSHENAHVQALTQTIQQLGGTPIGQCNYNFDMVKDPASYLSTAKLLENTGQGAYDGALNHLTNAQLQAAAASIATVEARHAAFLNKAVGTVPFPNATDPAYTPEEVIAAAKGFFKDCAGSTDFTPLISTIRPNGVTGTPAATVPKNIKIPQSNAQYTSAQKVNDLKVLNYALTLEHLEANFYNQFQGRYDCSISHSRFHKY
jgi:rubrerythrin